MTDNRDILGGGGLLKPATLAERQTFTVGREVVEATPRPHPFLDPKSGAEFSRQVSEEVDRRVVDDVAEAMAMGPLVIPATARFVPIEHSPAELDFISFRETIEHDVLKAMRVDLEAMMWDLERHFWSSSVGRRHLLPDPE